MNESTPINTGPVIPQVTLPTLPLKNTVLFPNLFMPLSVGRPNSLAAVEAALATEEKTLLVVAQRESASDQPGLADLYGIGTMAVIRKMARTPQGIEILVQGQDRVQLQQIAQEQPFLKITGTILPHPADKGLEVEALQRLVLEQARKAMEIVRSDNPIDINQLALQAGDPLKLCYLLGSLMSLDVPREQALLDASTQLEALQLLHTYLTHEIQVLEVRSQISTKAQSEMSREQRDYTLRQQLRAIQEELGDTNPEKADVDRLRTTLVEADLPEKIRTEANRELTRLERLPAASPEYQVIRSYLELVLELPWNKRSHDQLDLVRARQILDEDHYDLSEVKERILEHLAVLKLNPKAKAPILCFVGPPGVGKTSLGQSIARSMEKTFERASLGGLHEESELRGHRRTYIGAMPGRIIQAIRRAGVNNPVLMLDEIDKLGRDHRGDPAAALLEILDPAQNSTFRDNYLDLPFDLSGVFFVATANTLDTIPRPLLDRMEILRLSGYAEEEKMEIARRYLIPRQLSEIGIPKDHLTIPQDTVRRVISGYTREAGLRQLEHTLGRLIRKKAVLFAQGQTEPLTINPEELGELLGPEIFQPERARLDLPAGVATGLAWTESGGEVLYVEANLLPGGKGLRLTGQLGEVMRESAQAAQSYVWAHAERLGISPRKFRKAGVHIHVPSGAVPKDGPSAGVAMITALVSLYTGVPADRDTAMTGEITLTGLVLPIGGVKEKVLAARRAGIHRLILPRANEKDLQEIPDYARKELTFFLADRVEEVIAAAIPGLAAKKVMVSATE